MAPTKACYLHIGLHKTGTTTVQAFLSHNASLLETNSVLFPKVGRALLGHHNLAWELRGDPRFVRDRGDWQALKEEIERSDCERILLSSEDFSLLDDHGLDGVANRLRSHDVTIVCTLRRQDYLLNSIYTNFVRGEGVTIGFSELLEKNIGSKRFEFDGFLSRWASTFGQDRVIVRTYDRDYDAGFDSIADFLELGILSAGGEKWRHPRGPERDENPRPGAKTIRSLERSTTSAKRTTSAHNGGTNSCDQLRNMLPPSDGTSASM